MRNAYLFAASGLFALSTGHAAWAADAPEPAPDEIIVTGEKAERSLQDTITSVAVTTPQRIADENILTLQDVFQRTANVTETYGISGYTIRGIANRGINSGGDGALSTVYVDGAAMPFNLLQAAPTDMWDVGQVEILRGPQSTLQGLNSLAGAIIIQTAEPTMDWDFRARAMYASGNQRQFAAAVGGPIVPGELAFRVSVDKRDADGFTRAPTRNGWENPTDSLNLRGKLLWTPSSLPGFEARLGYTHFDRYGGYPFSYTDTTTPNFFDNRVNLSDFPNDSDANTDIGTLDLRYDFGGGLSLTSVSSYNHVVESNRNDTNFSAVPGGEYRQWNNFKTFTQELRLNYESDRFSGLLGGYYYNRTQNGRTTSLISVNTPLPLIESFLSANPFTQPFASTIATLYGQALPVIPVDYRSDATGRVRTLAVFADARYKLTDRLSLIAGFRYDSETSRISVGQQTFFTGTYPDPANFGPFAPAISPINDAIAGIVAGAAGAAVSLDRTFNAFLPKAGVEMAWTDDLKTAFTVQRGYRSGGSSTNIARTTTVPYDPEFTWNYELSLRSAWLDGALTVNANAFYIDWRKQQTLVNLGRNEYDTQTVNAGKSHLYGFELEAAHKVSPNFDWYASLGHVRTKFDEFVVSAGAFTDLSGLEFAYAPRWTLSGGFNARFFDKLHLNVNANYRGATFGEANVPQSNFRLKARTLVNARIAYEHEHFTLAVFARNLFDEDYIQYTAPGLGRAVLGDPQTFGVSLDVKW